MHLVELEDDLRVAARVKADAHPFETLTQFPMVVDLAVEHDHEFVRRVVQRLIALGRQVDDREASRAETGA